MFIQNIFGCIHDSRCIVG